MSATSSARSTPAPHRLDVVQHLIDGHGQGVVVSEDDHGERVAHQDDLGARGVDQSALRIVVGGNHGQAMTLRRGARHPWCGDLLRGFAHVSPPCVLDASPTSAQKRRKPFRTEGF